MQVNPNQPKHKTAKTPSKPEEWMKPLWLSELCYENWKLTTAMLLVVKTEIKRNLLYVSPSPQELGAVLWFVQLYNWLPIGRVHLSAVK